MIPTKVEEHRQVTTTSARGESTNTFIKTLQDFVFGSLNVLLPRTGLETWAGLALGVLGAFFTSIPLWGYLHSGSQKYPDLVAGYILWTDQFKDGDFLSVFTFIGLTVGFGLIGTLSTRVLMSRWLGAKPTQRTRNGVREFSAPLWLKAGGRCDILGALAMFLGALWVIRGAFPRAEAAVALAAVATYGCVLASYNFHGYFCGHFNGRRLRDLGDVGAHQAAVNEAVARALLFAALAPLTAIAIAAFRFWLSDDLATPVQIGITQSLLQYIAATALFMATVALVIVPRYASRALEITNATLQLSAPLLLIIYFRTAYRDSAGVVSFVTPNAIGVTFLAVVTFVMLIDVVSGIVITIKARPATKAGAESGVWSSHVRVSLVVALGAFLFFSPPPYSVTISDDFHLGETLIPWQQLTDFNQRLYRDFVSVQGFLGLSFGASNWLFFDNTLATYPIAAFWVLVIANGITAVLLSQRLGTGWALLLAPVTSTTLDRVLLVPLIFLLLTSATAMKSPLRWLLCFGCIAALHLLWIPSSGTALVLAGLPFAAYCALRVWQTSAIAATWRAQHRRLTLLSTALAAAVFVMLFPLVRGVVSFVIENGSTNTVAYGVRIGLDHVPPWFPRWFTSVLANSVIWESVRFGGWLVGAFVLGLVAIRTWRLVAVPGHPFSVRDPQKFVAPFFMALGGAIFCLALIPYSTGRIDAHALSRSGAVSMLFFGFFLPVSVLLAARNLRIWPVSVAILGLALGIRFAYAPPALGGLVERTANVVTVPYDTVQVDGPAVGLPNLGRGFVGAGKWDEIIRLRAALSKYLKPGETYFDLTNRSAFYYFLGLRVPSPYSADYLAANGKIQTRILQRLEREYPPVVWVSPAIRFDEAPASTRSYRLVRWFLERGYRFESQDGNHFLVRSDRLRAPNKPEDLAPIIPVLMRSDLEKLPIAWGRNFARLENLFKPAVKLESPNLQPGLLAERNGWVELRSGVPRFEFPVSLTQPASALAQRPDYLLLRLARRGPPNKRLRAEVTWSTSTAPFRRGSGLSFTVSPGTLLIPLGSDIRWQRAVEINALRLEISGETIGSKLRIDHAELLRLVN